MGWALAIPVRQRAIPRVHLPPSTIPSSPELQTATTPAPAGPTGPLRCSLDLSPSSGQCRHMSINQSIISQMSINQSNVLKSEIWTLF